MDGQGSIPPVLALDDEEELVALMLASTQSPAHGGRGAAPPPPLSLPVVSTSMRVAHAARSRVVVTAMDRENGFMPRKSHGSGRAAQQIPDRKDEPFVEVRGSSITADA
jgi:hypothetical protein